MSREIYRGILGRVCEYSHYRPHHGAGQYGSTVWETVDVADEGESMSYGDLHDIGNREVDPSKHYIVPDLLCGSDYSGSTLEIANLAGFLRQYGESAGVHEVYGGHGTRGAAIRLDCLTDDMERDLAALSDYPVWDDEELSMVESEMEDDAWESWAERDLRRGLEKHWSIDIDGSIEREWFETIRERENEYWHADGPSMYVNVDLIVKETTIDDLLALTCAWEFVEEDGANRFLACYRQGDETARAPLMDYLEERGVI